MGDGTSTSSETVTVNVNDLATTITAGQIFGVSETAPNGAAVGIVVAALGYFAAFSLMSQINMARFSSGIPVELSTDPVVSLFQSVNGWYEGTLVPAVNGILISASPALNSASAYLPDVAVGVISSLIAGLLLSRRSGTPLAA